MTDGEDGTPDAGTATDQAGADRTDSTVTRR